MALKLKKSPLPDRIDPPAPLREWVWTAPGPFHGVFATDPQALLPLLDVPARMVRVAEGYCLFFDTARTLDPAEVVGLPLRRMGPERYASYDTSDQRSGLSLILQGAPQLISLQDAETVDPLSLWDFSAMATTQGRPPPAFPTAIPKTGKPQQTPTPELNRNLKAIAGGPQVFERIKENTDAIKEPRLGSLTRAIGSFSGRLLATLLLVFIYFWITLATLRLGASGGALGLIAAVAVLMWYFGFFGLRGLGSGNATGTKRGWGAGPSKGRGTSPGPAPAHRGLLGRLREMALWNTSLGNKLRRELQRHLDEVNKMIDQGDIDRALKRAMSLSKEEERKNKRSPLMMSPPKPRANLDFDLNRSEGTVAIPGNWGFEELRDKYRDLAEDLSAKGDHRRAAFIYAELLDDVPPALAELEKIEAYEDAAKLATARKQSGHTLVRLWYLAGNKEVALLMARRHQAMQVLADVAEKEPEFAAFVRQHWVEDLVTEGDLPRAVAESANNERLAALHLRVLEKAISAGHILETPVLEEALKTLPWTIEALNASSDEANVVGRLEQVVHQGIVDPTVGDIRQRLWSGVTGLEASDPRKAALTDALIRASLSYDADTPYALQSSELRRLARAGGCAALAEDLRQIHRLKPKERPSRANFPLPQTGTGQWTMAAAIQGGAALLANSNGEMALFDLAGDKRWTDHLPDLVGLVPVSSGRLVLLVQGRDSLRRISVLDTTRRSYRALGSIKLLEWDRYAGDGTWQIQTPEAIGALDLAQLLAEEPTFEMLWSITQTIPVKVLAFQSTPHMAQWLTQRLDMRTGGLMELWRLQRNTQSLTVWLESENGGQELAATPHVWLDHNFAAQKTDTRELKYAWLQGTKSLEGNEAQLLNKIDLSLRQKTATVTAAPASRLFAIENTGSGKSTVDLDSAPPNPCVRLRGHHPEVQSATRDGQHLVVVTDTGLTLLCNLRTMSVVTLTS